MLIRRRVVLYPHTKFVSCPRRAEVEVCGLEEEGFALGFYRASVVKVTPEHVVVRDLDLYEEDNSQVIETIPVESSERLRPIPPCAEPRPIEKYSVGEPVDAWELDVWYQGIVIMVEKKQRVLVAHPGRTRQVLAARAQSNV